LALVAGTAPAGTSQVGIGEARPAGQLVPPEQAIAGVVTQFAHRAMSYDPLGPGQTYRESFRNMTFSLDS
jgi:hypothetical protein